MNDRPLVSIIIPTYNAERWIRETVHSALAQTYAPLEIIVIDDSSKDNTLSILAEFGNKIHVIKNSSNQGVSLSRNAAIAAAQGLYIALLDHDDLWHPQKLEKQMSLFEASPGLGLVYCDVLYETGVRNRWRSFQINPPSKGNVLEKMLQQNFILCLTAVFPRSVFMQVGQFRARFRFAEDFDLFLRIAEHYPVDFINEPLAIYRIHDQNFSRHVDISYNEVVEILESHRSRPNVMGTMAMVHIRWGMDAWRRDRRWRNGLLHVLKGLLLGVRGPIGFLKALRESWRQRKRARALI